MQYISLFSGIGGLESKDTQPIIACEKNKACLDYLGAKFTKTELINDVKTLTKKTFTLPKVDIVTGGWPCQDISVGGQQKGFDGEHSVLFYELLKVAKKAQAELIIAENVPNLLNIEKGAVFTSVLEELSKNGYEYISWRLLNSREFNLPHQRRRVFIFASKSEQSAKNLFNPINIKIKTQKSDLRVGGFYHTAGTHSICYSQNFVPTLKVSGSSPAVFYNNTIRRLTASESLKLQGFKPSHFKDIPMSHIFAMTGNAVSKPIGEFLFNSINLDVLDLNEHPLNAPELIGGGYSKPKSFPQNGFYKKGVIFEISMHEKKLCSNLGDFIDTSCNEFLSATAILGILRRTSRAGKQINHELLNTMIAQVTKKALEKEIGRDNIAKLFNANIFHDDVSALEELSF